MYWIWKNIQLNISSASQIVQKLLGELKFQEELIFQEPRDIGSPLAFSLNETLPFRKKFENQSCVWDLLIFKSFQHFKGSTSISARELIF